MKPKREWTAKEIALMRSQQYTQQELADLFGCARLTISRAFKELGIAPKKQQVVQVTAKIPNVLLASVDAKVRRLKITRYQAVVQALELWTKEERK